MSGDALPGALLWGILELHLNHLVLFKPFKIVFLTFKIISALEMILNQYYHYLGAA